MTTPYAFTDYRAQGQTLSYVLVDIGTPPTGTHIIQPLRSPFAEFRSFNSTIRLLRDFEDSLFQSSHDPASLAEGDILEQLGQSIITR
ncbi:hypothetical protein L208DRAFT_898902 [Tricholoma matsutake]|nr:hypothetical protein L208DRAFT_898902 [Tricholoma matsutake 945]